MFVKLLKHFFKNFISVPCNLLYSILEKVTNTSLKSKLNILFFNILKNFFLICYFVFFYSSTKNMFGSEYEK